MSKAGRADRGGAHMNAHIPKEHVALIYCRVSTKAQEENGTSLRGRLEPTTRR
jgi:hypothetical protein